MADNDILYFVIQDEPDKSIYLSKGVKGNEREFFQNEQNYSMIYFRIVYIQYQTYNLIIIELYSYIHNT